MKRKVVAYELLSLDGVADEPDGFVTGHVTWFALRENATPLGMFDAVGDEQGRRAHQAGQNAAAPSGLSRQRSACRRRLFRSFWGPRSPERPTR
jgi:hypothetical protein